MLLRIRSPKDFGAGLLYGGFGLTAILMAWDFGMGSASRMGPGYFPTALGALLLRPAGLVPALVALILVGASASARFRLEWRASLLMLALIAFCALVFVKGLGLPLSLLGPWVTR